MPFFSRSISLLSVLTLFAGFAGAQVGGTGQQQLTCNTNVTVTPALRGEGFTEQTGDITISCTGGTALTPGSQIPLVNFAIFYNTTVTSRLLPTGIPGGENVSEAFLLIDEPGSGLPGYGPSLPLVRCSTPLTGCAATVGAVAGPTFGQAVSSGSTPAPNVYQGVVSGNSVVFNGIPVLPPGNTASRVFRINNVRINAQPLAGGSPSGASPVQASISISGATSLTISNPTPNVGYVSNGLSATANGATNVSQCTSQTRTSAATLTFSENFGTAFKTRVAAQTNTLYAGQVNNPVQNIPGAIYNSESNFVVPINGTQVAGLTDFGTRLKATFNNVPNGVTIFVSTSNVNNSASPIVPPLVPGGSAANANNPNGYTGYAQSVNSESVTDGSANPFPSVPSTDVAQGVPIAAIPITNGTGTAVWEVVNTNPNTIESFKFAVYLSYVANAGQNSPLPGTTTANLSFAATAASGAADAGSPLPRFASDANAARNLFTIQACNACGSVINPSSIPNFPPTAASGTTTVSANAGCPWTAVSNTPWLSVTQGSTGSGNGTVQFSTLANNSGTARTGTLTIAGQTLSITQRVPALTVGNAANYTSVPEQTVSPGELIVLQWPVSNGPIPGVGAGNLTAGVPLPTNLGGMRALFDGTPAPLLFASDTSVRAIVPYGIAGNSSTLIEVEYNGTKFDFARVAVAPVTPLLYKEGVSQVYLLVPPGYDNTYYPVLPGMSATVYLTGAGLTNPAGTDGRIYSSSETLPTIVLPVTVSVGGVPAQILSDTVASFELLGPGYYKIIFIVPPGAPSGTGVPFSVSVGGTATPAGTTINVSATSCSFNLDQSSHPATAPGGADSVNVITTTGCSWTATSNVNWLTINSGSSGADSGAVSFTVSPSNSLTPRNGTLTVAGLTFTINQAAAAAPACATPPAGIVWFQSVNYFSAANSASDLLIVGNMPQDKYSLLNSVAFPTAVNQRFCTQIPIAPGYLADAYVPTAAERLGDFSPFSGILLDPLTAHQDPFPAGVIPINRIPATMAWRLGNYTTCTVSVALGGDQSTVPAAGSGRSVIVTAGNSTCGWVAAANAAWVTFPSGNTGVGSQGVSYSVASNPTTGSRSAIITVAGQTFTVTQQASIIIGIAKSHIGNFTQGQAGAMYTVTVSNQAGTFPTSGTVTVTESVPTGMTLVSMTGSGWTCVTNTCTRGDALPAGSSYPLIAVTVNVAANATSPLVNAVSVSGGGAPTANTTDSTIVYCTCQLSGNGVYSSSAGSGTITIATNSAGYWAASADAPWLHITSSASGTGSGQVNYNVGANLASFQRFGTLTIAGQTFTIIQGAYVTPPPNSGLRYVPITPCRIADTRSPAGAYGGPSLAAATPRDFNIQASACGIPANAQAYSLNLTVVPLGPLGFLSVWPAGQPQPVASTLNSGDGRIKANAAIVPAGTNGAITLFGSHPTHVIVDINGYFVPTSGNANLAFYPLTPCRIADTRLGGIGTFNGPALAPGASRDFPLLSSACGIPSNARAYALNMTVVPSGALGFLSAWPAGSPQPGSSTLNAPTDAITANAAIVPAGANGAITLIATNATDVIIDINGYFAPPGNPGGMQFYTTTPCRILDTRGAAGPFGAPQLPAAASREFVVAASACNIPATAGAYSLNATVVPPGPLGFLSLWGPGGQPVVSALNAGDGTIVANAALVPASNTGSVTAFASQLTNLILDINGYFAQ